MELINGQLEGEIEQIPKGTVKKITDWVIYGEEAEHWKLTDEVYEPTRI